MRLLVECGYGPPAVRAGSASVSYIEAPEPECSQLQDSIEMLIEPQQKDLGEFSVRRVLPAPDRKAIGPFVFFDHMGPATFGPGKGIQVRPHPHIGLATITYLFEGEIVHRDSLGYLQPIRPGAVNLMTAGRGIVHSERAGEDLARTSRLHGIQSWMALPAAQEEVEPAFEHYPAESLPEVNRPGAVVRVILGQAFDVTSPVSVASPTLYLSVELEAGARLTLPRPVGELAAYVVEGSVRTGGRQLDAGVMAVVRAPESLSLSADRASRIMVIGGASLGPRHLYWNLVSTSPDRIERAKRDWREGRFPPVPGDDEFIPLPED